jgi:trbN protein
MMHAMSAGGRMAGMQRVPKAATAAVVCALAVCMPVPAMSQTDAQESARTDLQENARMGAQAFPPGVTPMPRVNERDTFYSVGPADINCVLVAAERQGVPANVLLAIASVENGRNGQAVQNTNGTLDIGHFQINTMHWDENGIFWNKPGITREDVAWRGCFNAEVAAWMLRQHLEEKNGQDYWTRAANYHSRTPRFNTIYRQRLIQFATSWAQYLEREYGGRLSVSQQ